MADSESLLENLPATVYTTDAAGTITYYNRAAAELWAREPRIGIDQWCGSFRLYWPDGQPMSHDECPMAVTLRTGEEVRGAEAVLERPDGSRVPFAPYPRLIRDSAGRVAGAMNVLADLSPKKEEDLEAARLAAIVASSDDAIISKTLDGVVRTWNSGAERIFGYLAEEIIGKSIYTIIPEHLRDEEAEILAKLQRGERVDHFDTIRRRKDGGLVNVSLTISPLRNRTGTVVGASKIARDITERKEAEELQKLLFQELNHRVKNTLAMVQTERASLASV